MNVFLLLRREGGVERAQCNRNPIGKFTLGT